MVALPRPASGAGLVAQVPLGAQLAPVLAALLFVAPPVEAALTPGVATSLAAVLALPADLVTKRALLLLRGSTVLCRLAGSWTLSPLLVASLRVATSLALLTRLAPVSASLVLAVLSALPVACPAVLARPALAGLLLVEARPAVFAPLLAPAVAAALLPAAVLPAAMLLAAVALLAAVLAAVLAAASTSAVPLLAVLLLPLLVPLASLRSSRLPTLVADLPWLVWIGLSLLVFSHDRSSWDQWDRHDRRVLLYLCYRSVGRSLPR